MLLLQTNEVTDKIIHGSSFALMPLSKMHTRSGRLSLNLAHASFRHYAINIPVTCGKLVSCTEVLALSRPSALTWESQICQSELTPLAFNNQGSQHRAVFAQISCSWIPATFLKYRQTHLANHTAQRLSAPALPSCCKCAVCCIHTVYTSPLPCHYVQHML